MDTSARRFARTRKWFARLFAVTALFAGFYAPVYVVTHPDAFDDDPPMPADLRR